MPRGIRSQLFFEFVRITFRKKLYLCSAIGPITTEHHAKETKWNEFRDSPLAHEGQRGQESALRAPAARATCHHRRCENAGLPRNTLTSVFNYFHTACAEFLADGKRIKTPMGVFSPRLALKRQITDPADVHVEDVEWNGVEFQPSQRFMDEIMRWSRGFKHEPFYDKNAKAPTEAQLQQALERSIADIGGHTTVSSFRFFAGLTRHSAQKYLNSLCAGEHPQLARRLVGRTFIYEKCGQ